MSCPNKVETFLCYNLADINECAIRKGDCLHQCVNLPGSYRCVCRRGFRLVNDKCQGTTYTKLNIVSCLKCFTSCCICFPHKRLNQSNALVIYMTSSVTIEFQRKWCRYIEDGDFTQRLRRREQNVLHALHVRFSFWHRALQRKTFINVSSFKFPA